MKTVEDYIQMEYKLKVVSKKDFDGSDYYVASYEELEGLEGVGNTKSEAIDDLEAAKEIWFEVSLENDFEIPMPK